MKEYLDVLNSKGEYINQIETRKNCHKKGLWHKAAFVFILSEDNQKVLLQKRSAKKKLSPNKWSSTAGGHVLAGELGCQSVIREAKEELGINIDEKSLRFIGTTIVERNREDIINRQFDEYFILNKNIDLKDIVLQEEEVQDIKWFDKDTILTMIKNNDENLSDKIGGWNYLQKYFEIINQ